MSKHGMGPLVKRKRSGKKTKSNIKKQSVELKFYSISSKYRSACKILMLPCSPKVKEAKGGGINKGQECKVTEK